MELKKKDLRVLLDAITDCRKLTGAKFSYALVKNYNKIELELKILGESQQEPSEKLALYFKIQKATIQSYAKKDDKGEYIYTVDDKGLQHYTFIDESKVVAAIKKLKLEYPEEMAELDRINKDYAALLNEPCDIEFYKIKLDCIPNGISVEQMSSIEILIEE